MLWNWFRKQSGCGSN